MGDQKLIPGYSFENFVWCFYHKKTSKQNVNEARMQQDHRSLSHLPGVVAPVDACVHLPPLGLCVRETLFRPTVAPLSLTRFRLVSALYTSSPSGTNMNHTLKGHYMGLNLPCETAKFGRPTRRRQHRQALKISCWIWIKHGHAPLFSNLLQIFPQLHCSG